MLHEVYKEEEIKIASWNLCLGLPNKKEYFSQIITANKIDICCMQEVGINMDYDHQILSFSGYSLLIESNDDKSRSGIYVKNGINYERRTDLEQRNNGIVILDINVKTKFRLINLYRSFNPTGVRSQREFFVNQLQTIKSALEGRDNKIQHKNTIETTNIS